MRTNEEVLTNSNSLVEKTMTAFYKDIAIK